MALPLPSSNEGVFINVVSKITDLAAADFIFNFTSSSLPSPPKVGQAPASIETLMIQFLTEVAPN